MRILLLNPPSANEHIPENPPLGLLYLASVLRKENDVWVIDFDALKYDWGQIKSRLIKENPDVIGITCTTYSYKNLKEICRVAKRHLLKTKIIVGGAHVTAKPQICLQETKADFAVVGEGEVAIQEILRNLNTKKRKDKITYGEKIQNLDEIPFPSRDLLEPDITSYLGNLPRHHKPETVMLWSRGCPHNCLFCSNPVYKGQKPRFRSPENIVKELKELKRIGVKELFVYDDELVGMGSEQNKWLRDICNLIIKERLNFIFKCQGRCSKFVDSQTLKLMEKAGFKTIMWGCESGSDNVLRAIKKGITVSEIKNSIKLCKKAGIEAWMFLMVGNYTEKPEDIEKTIELVKKCKPTFIQVTYATPYPSEFENICEKNSWIIEGDRSKWNTNKPVIKTENMNEKELENYRKKILSAYKIQKIIGGEMPLNAFNKHFGILIQTYRNFGLKTTLKKSYEFAKRALNENI